jgi:hypothetical protein
MTFVKVNEYALGYSVSDRKFFLDYTLDGDSAAHQIFLSPEEFSAIGRLFKGKRPISFNPDGQYFVSALKAV